MKAIFSLKRFLIVFSILMLFEILFPNFNILLNRSGNVLLGVERKFLFSPTVIGPAPYGIPERIRTLSLDSFFLESLLILILSFIISHIQWRGIFIRLKHIYTLSINWMGVRDKKKFFSWMASLLGLIIIAFYNR